MFEGVLNEIEEINKLEEESWNVFRQKFQNPMEMQIAIFKIQWCIQRRTAAFTSITNFANLGTQVQQSERQVIAPR